jgi:uncharacterized protein Yka (UPF0111/DUF47 family)
MALIMKIVLVFLEQNVLRKIIKALVPSKGDIFFTLFEEAAINANEAAKIFVDILNCKNEELLLQMFTNSRLLKQKSVDNNKKILLSLNRMFITPIDRGDIQELSGLFNKLTKRIVKISTKLKIYNIDAKSDDILVKNANTLLLITQALVDCVTGLKQSNSEKILVSSEKINELEENGIEDFRQAVNEMYSGKFDTLMILKLKEIYKSIDVAIETSVSAADLVVQVSVKSI